MEANLCQEQTALLPYAYRMEIEQELRSPLAVLGYQTDDSRVVVRTAAKILRMNLLECTLVCWLLAKPPKDHTMDQSSRTITVFHKPHQRRLFLILLLNGYHAKSFLAKGCIDVLCDADVLHAVPDFPSIYLAWQPWGELGSLRLAQLNGLFEQRAVSMHGGKDYNVMVRSILEMSKSYNIAHKPQPRQRKKGKKKAMAQKQEPQGEEEEQQEGEEEGMQATPLYQPQQSQVAEAPQGVLRISSGTFRFREPGLLDRSESRPIFASLHASESSVLYSGQRRGIKQTSSFFDDI